MVYINQLNVERSAMGSLKSQIPNLAGWLSMTPAALYERQRALVRAGLLKAKPGRGRGTGVAFSPHSLAMLLISVAASDSLTETAEMTKIFTNLKSDTEKCPITGKKTFGAALTHVLDSELLPHLGWIDAEVSWDEYRAFIVLRKEDDAAGDQPGKPYIDSRFSLRRTGRGVIRRRTSLFLDWLPRALGKKNERQHHPTRKK
jgi:hypothetical protein